MHLSLNDGLFFKLGLAACLIAPSLACNGDGKDSETDAATTTATTGPGTSTDPGTGTSDPMTSTNGPTSTTNGTDPTSTTNGTDPTTNGTDPTGGGGDAQFCQEECAGDADCTVGGQDIGLKCIDKRCASDIPPCTANEQCQAQFSGWFTECQDDTACEALLQVCIDIGDPNAGRCATPPSDVIMCETLMQSEITAKKFMDGSDVQVCANTSSECHPDGYCFDPCESNTDCEMIAGLPMCNVGTGACECASDDDCKNSGVDGWAVCNNGVCGCGSDADCAGSDNADKCYDGACGCSDVAVCQADPVFDGTTKVCEGF
jgi:hypothetical protein